MTTEYSVPIRNVVWYASLKASRNFSYISIHYTDFEEIREKRHAHAEEGRDNEIRKRRNFFSLNSH